MPRIAILFEYPTLLGGEHSLLVSLERLKSEFDFVALAPLAGQLVEALECIGIETIPSPLFDENSTRLSRDRALLQLKQTIRLLGTDLLHANSLAMGRFSGAIAPEMKVPSVAHLRDIIRLSAKAVDDLNRNAKLVAVSEATKTFHIGQGIDPERTTVVYNGVDLERFAPRQRNPAFRQRLGIPQEAFVTLTIGQIGLRKGWDVLADASVRIVGAIPALHMLFVGERYSHKPETVAYEAKVYEQLSSLLPGRIHFLGYRTDVPDLMAASDLLVHPARQEPFGRVLLEAAAARLPIVATDVGGTRELLQDGISARLVPPNNSDHLAVAVNALFINSDLRRCMADAARQQVEKSFSADAAARHLAAVWHGLLAR